MAGGVRPYAGLGHDLELVSIRELSHPRTGMDEGCGVGSIGDGRVPQAARISNIIGSVQRCSSWRGYQSVDEGWDTVDR